MSSPTKKRRLGPAPSSPANARQSDLRTFFGDVPKTQNTDEVVELSDSSNDPGSADVNVSAPAASSIKVKSPEKSEPDDKTASAAPGPSGEQPWIGNNSTSALSDQNATTYPLDLDIFEFEPLLHIPVSTWPRSKTDPEQIQIPYSFLAAAFVMISATRSRLVIITILTNTIRSIIAYEPDALCDAVYLITNHIGPSYDGVELGVGSQVMIKVLKESCALGPKDIKKLWNQYGDMGDVAFAAKNKIRTLVSTSPLLITGVYATLRKIADLKGQKVTEKKVALVQKMLIAAKGEEVRYIARTLDSNLRIGAVRLTVTTSLARAFCLVENHLNDEENETQFSITRSQRAGLKANVKSTGKQAKTKLSAEDEERRVVLLQKLHRAENRVRQVFVQHPNYNDIIPALLSHGLSHLMEHVSLSVGTPLNPMLGQITRDVSEVSTRLPPDAKYAAEWKYDGQRVQIHALHVGRVKQRNMDLSLLPKQAGKYVNGDSDIFVRLFSRHLEDMTEKYPDILALIPEMFNPIEEQYEPVSFIMDAEICAIDPKSGALQTFQTLSNRAKKDVQIGDIKVRVGIFAFDLMYLNGNPLLQKSFRNRRNLMRKYFPERISDNVQVARFSHVKSLDGSTEDLEPLKAFMNEAIENKCEGLMVKLLDSDERLVNDQGDAEISKEQKHSDFVNLAEEQNPYEENAEDENVAVVGRTKSSDAQSTKPRKPLLATYEPDKRGDSWLKCKRDYGALGDSLDFVPIGAWHGMGRKAGWWSPILLAVNDPESGNLQAVCKCISGFTDAFYISLNEKYPKDSATCSSSAPLASVDTGTVRPDVWWLPSEVWEIRGADITQSPVYPASQGIVTERGLSLRFPRFYRIREDKHIEDATSAAEFAEAYRRQEGR